jgi:hypothetical protein
LRRVAQSRVAAIEKDACTKIELHCLETSTQILAHRLSSGTAREFLAQLPAIPDLMPPLDMQQVATMLEARKPDQVSCYGYHYSNNLMPEPRRED